MSRLSLDAFKTKANNSQLEELENLSGGILGACHECSKGITDAQAQQLVDWILR